MLRRFRERLTYANVVSTLTLFMFLGTGTAYATHLIVNSSDVVDESLVSADLKNGAAVRATDVVSNALTGGTINESTLAQVPSATLGGLGRTAATGDDSIACDPEGSAYVRCVSLTIRLPAPARVLLNGRIGAAGEWGSNAGAAWCRWGGVVTSGTVNSWVNGYPDERDLSLVGLTGAMPAGEYTFAIECNDVLASSYPNGAVQYRDAWMTAVAISPS